MLVRTTGKVLLASSTLARQSPGSVALPANTAAWISEDCVPLAG
ncbi:hypothetical protein O2W15_17115 [Modestobacter sp. VKM Ac-2979]|nr:MULTISPECIES: hypothetical protein [unclassified Modestobacter]MCZ2813155.1 hypothetical protein [Modestobacter sp. VKM Ac-2979]MCZ2842816.1 hypothetical protein [Modestobacter sp. VKM Ac-2980]